MGVKNDISARFIEAYDTLLTRKEVTDKKDFATKLGISASMVTEISKGRSSVGTSAIQNIVLQFNISADWLLTGKGDMIINNTINENGITGSDDSLSAYNIVPLVPISAQGGSLNDFCHSVMSYDCEKVVSPIKGVDFAMSVSGDSMAPEYPSGCQILIKKINERAFIDWGRVYVLDTINGSVIKKLMPASTPDKVLCVSINPDYPPFEVSLEHVYGVYRVMMCMSLK